MAEDNNTSKNSVADGENVPPAAGEGNASEDVVSVKDLLGEELGRTFKSDEEALKAVKETANYVGKMGKFKPLIEKLQALKGGEPQLIKFMEDLAITPQPEAPKTSSEIDTSKFVPRDQYETDTFFSKRPELVQHREVLEALSMKSNKPVTEVAESEAFKAIFDKVKGYDDAQSAKSVLQTNPRLGQVTDKISKAKDAVKAGNQAEARANAVGAVIDAYELK